MENESWAGLFVIFLIHFFVGRGVQGLIKVQWPFIALALAVACIAIYYWPLHMFSLSFSLASAAGFGVGVYLRQVADD